MTSSSRCVAPRLHLQGQLHPRNFHFSRRRARIFLGAPWKPLAARRHTTRHPAGWLVGKTEPPEGLEVCPRLVLAVGVVRDLAGSKRCATWPAGSKAASSERNVPNLPCPASSPCPAAPRRGERQLPKSDPPASEQNRMRRVRADCARNLICSHLISASLLSRGSDVPESGEPSGKRCSRVRGSRG